MFAMTVRFSVPPDTDWEALRRLMARRAYDLFRHVPGLRSTIFVVSPERSELGGNYVWETQEDSEAFLDSELWRGIVADFGEPRIEQSEACAYVEDGDLVFPPDYEWHVVASETLPPPLA